MLKSENGFRYFLRLIAKYLECRFGITQAKFLGHIVSKNDIIPDDFKNEIKKIVLPDSVTKLRPFLGLFNFYMDFIDHFEEKSH